MTLNLSRTLRLPVLMAFMAMMVIVAACSSSGGGATTAPSAAPSAAGPSKSASAAPSEAAPSSAAPAAGAIELKLGTGALGSFLTDGSGKTLYMFTPDEGGTPTCYDQCAASWPAVTASAASDVTVGTGLDQSKVKVVDRTDGTKQVIYGEYPLYYFAKDAAAGDTNGQGLNQKWYVVGDDGEPIKS